jgi:hypothetical protein
VRNIEVPLLTRARQVTGEEPLMMLVGDATDQVRMAWRVVVYCNFVLFVLVFCCCFFLNVIANSFYYFLLFLLLFFLYERSD